MKGNRHIVAKDTPTANLLLAMAHLGGAEIESSERVRAGSISKRFRSKALANAMWIDV